MDSFIPEGQAQESKFPEFVKFTNVGDAVVGRVVDFGENDTGRFVVLSPCVRRGADGVLGQPAVEMAVGLTAGLRGLVKKDHMGQFVVIQFASLDMERGQRGNALKMFKLWVMSEKDAAKRFAHGVTENGTNVFDFALRHTVVNDGKSPF